MNETEYQTLLEIGWRRPLTFDEQARLEAWLAAHPEAQAQWEAEAALNRCLSQLSDVPVASNFTARVLEALDRPSPQRRRSPFLEGLKSLFWRPVPQLAWALVLAGLVGWA